MPHLWNTIKILLLALWFLKILTLQCLCSIRYWFGNAVYGEKEDFLTWWWAFGLTAKAALKNSFPLFGCVWRGLLGLISVNSSGLPLMELVHCAGGIAISSSCLLWEWSFSSALLLEPRFFFLLLPLVILETLFYVRKQFSAALLPQDEYWSLTIMQQSYPWDTLLEDRLTMHERSRRNRFDWTTYQVQMQATKKLPSTNASTKTGWKGCAG